LDEKSYENSSKRVAIAKIHVLGTNIVNILVIPVQLPRLGYDKVAADVDEE